MWTKSKYIATAVPFTYLKRTYTNTGSCTRIINTEYSEVNVLVLKTL